MNDPLDIVSETMPAPQEHAIAAEVEKEEAAQVTGFDTSIHEQDASGQPILNKNGSFRKRRGVKPGSKSNQSKLSIPGNQPGSIPTDAGKQMAESIFAMGQMIGGEEWAPIYNVEYGIDERRQMHDAFTRYCEAKEIRDFPPGVAIAMCVVGYIAPRFAMPKTKSRFQKVKEWAYSKYGSWRGRKQARTTDNGEARPEIKKA